uniref:Uncharacterized protein n=1 Tax=Dactylella sp. TaxID=1814903 RepID=A0A482DT25_9PEZI|nr:hypothetical protein [Dactylella sp.]
MVIENSDDKLDKKINLDSGSNNGVADSNVVENESNNSEDLEDSKTGSNENVDECSEILVDSSENNSGNINSDINIDSVSSEMVNLDYEGNEILSEDNKQAGLLNNEDKGINNVDKINSGIENSNIDDKNIEVISSILDNSVRRLSRSEFDIRKKNYGLFRKRNPYDRHCIWHK